MSPLLPSLLLSLSPPPPFLLKAAAAPACLLRLAAVTDNEAVVRGRLPADVDAGLAELVPTPTPVVAAGRVVLEELVPTPMAGEP